MRESLEHFIGVLQRQWRLVAISFLLFSLVPILVALALRPSFTATALVVMEPVPADLLAPGGQTGATAPNSALVDGAVEIMRSEPVLKEALARLAPVDADKFASVLDVRSRVLAFFGNRAAPIASDMLSDAQMLKLIRSAISVNRRGLTPVIAISGRSASPAFGARLANAVAEAYMDLQSQAKADSLGRAKALIDAQVMASEADLAQSRRSAEILLEDVRALVDDGDIDQQFLDRLGAMPLEAALDDAFGIEGLPADIRGRLMGARADLSSLQIQHDALRRRTTELATQAALQLPDVRLAAAASPPIDASFPDVRTTALIAVLFSGCLAAGIGMTADSWPSGVRNTAELAALVGVPLALAMPKIKTRRFDGSSHADEVASAPLSAFSEAMRSLQLNLGRSLEGPGGKIVAVMSVGQGEGKTTTALGLSRAFAAAGQRVLLIDADARSAALRNHLDVPSARGFEQVLSGMVGLGDLTALVQRDPLSNLSVLINSGPSTLPAEALFGTPAFAAIVQGARQSFGTTILDMPSFSWPADSAYILPHVDAVVLVAGWGRAEKTKLQDMLATIRAAQGGRPLAIQPVLSMQPQAVKWPLVPSPLTYASR